MLYLSMTFNEKLLLIYISYVCDKKHMYDHKEDYEYSQFQDVCLIGSDWNVSNRGLDRDKIRWHKFPMINKKLFHKTLYTNDISYPIVVLIVFVIYL